MKINIGGENYTIIDLTEPLREDTEVYPGDPKPTKEIFSEIKKTGYQHYIFRIGDHNFHPHGDAPNHQNLNMQDKGFEFFDIKYCFNYACLIDLSDCENAEEIDGVKYLMEIKREHLDKYAKIISERTALIIRTGYDKWLDLNKPHQPSKIPYLNKEAADFISSFDNIKVFGIDSITIDAIGSHYAHQKFKNMLIVESLVHLYAIPSNKKDNFLCQTSPVRIVGATGGPIIAYAFVKE